MKKSSFPGYSTDEVALRVFRGLLRDFRAVHGQDFAKGAELALARGIDSFRSYEWPAIGAVDPSRFKAWMQLRSLFKRHIFMNDVYTANDLEVKTNESYVKAQEEFAQWREVKPRTFAVLQEARRVCSCILGKLDVDEVASYVQIGRRATLGNPLHKSYLDDKMGDPSAFTCPTAARKWFFTDYLATDGLLKSIVKGIFKKSKKIGTPIDLAVDYLNLVNVPKSWKTLRGITPLTVIGLFLSYGIGGLFAARLRSFGLNIDKLQSKHRKLARKYSRPRPGPGLGRYGSHVTVDLRRASDSILSQYLNAVLPRAWYKLLRLTFVRTINIVSSDCTRTIQTCSVLPMGNGATFPVETLFFYCLIRAVGNLLGVNGTYSVYGDDLIYPKRIHPYVVQVFADLGIGVNEEKSFVNSYFRESCGGDYYRGVDVRPALLPENTPYLKGKRYAAYLYKIANALRARWDDTEIPTTLNLLLSELAYTQRKVYQVPLHFPATSGWKTQKPRVSTEWFIPWEIPKVAFAAGRALVRFKFLGQATPEKRDVEREEVYYWDTLRSMSLRKPKNWQFWKTWLVEVPNGERKLHEHGTFMFRKEISYVTHNSKRHRVVTQIPQVPSKKDTGFDVADEVVPIDFWIQGAVER